MAEDAEPKSQQAPYPDLKAALLSVDGVEYDEDLEATQRAQQKAGRVQGINWAGIYNCFFEVFGCNQGGLDQEHIAKWQLPIDQVPNTTQQTSDKRTFDIFMDLRAPLTMQFVINYIVKPATASKQCALLDIFFGLTIQNQWVGTHRPEELVGGITDFHSYTWQEAPSATFQALFSSMEGGYDDLERFIWWDIFCQNQWVIGDVGKTFSTAISQIDRFLFSIPSLDHPRALQRVWCLFEVVHGVAVKFDMITRLADNGELALRLSKTDPSDCFVDVRDAQAFHMADKEMLLGLIEEQPGGVQRLNTVVQTVYTRVFYSKLLVQACRFHLLEVADIAFSHGADPNLSDSNGKTPLVLAVEAGDKQMADWLLSRGALATRGPNPLCTFFCMVMDAGKEWLSLERLQLASQLHHLGCKSDFWDRVEATRKQKFLDALRTSKEDSTEVKRLKHELVKTVHHEEPMRARLSRAATTRVMHRKRVGGGKARADVLSEAQTKRGCVTV